MEVGWKQEKDSGRGLEPGLRRRGCGRANDADEGVRARFAVVVGDVKG